MAIGFIFCHGWGMTPAFWENLLPFFREYPCIVWDLGYFGEARQDIPADDNIQWVGVGHSLGLAKLLTSHISFSAAIGIQSFLRFCAHDFNRAGTPIRVVKKMEQAISVDPSRVLENFYQQCRIGDVFNILDNINAKNLLLDLRLLKTLDLREVFVGSKLPVYFLATKSDPIVANELGFEMRDVFKGSQLDFYDGEHHGLGYYCAPQCARDIRKFLQALELE